MCIRVYIYGKNFEMRNRVYTYGKKKKMYIRVYIYGKSFEMYTLLLMTELDCPEVTPCG